MEIVAVDLVALIEEEQTHSPVVVLHDKKGNRVLPIWIGEPEARAISIALNNMQAPRPLTHHLVLNIFTQLGYTLSYIVVDRMQQNTYYATLHIHRDKEEMKIDARPSDALALALTARIPIFVSKEVMDKAGEPNPFPADIHLSQQGGPRNLNLNKEELQRVSDILQKAQEREANS